MVLPGVPGGAGTLIKGARAADKAVGALRAGDAVGDIATTTNKTGLFGKVKGLFSKKSTKVNGAIDPKSPDHIRANHYCSLEKGCGILDSGKIKTGQGETNVFFMHTAGDVKHARAAGANSNPLNARVTFDVRKTEYGVDPGISPIFKKKYGAHPNPNQPYPYQMSRSGDVNLNGRNPQLEYKNPNTGQWELYR